MWYVAILLGVTGSLHCAGMCSPLAAAVFQSRKTSWSDRLIYNAGRIFTYGLLGWVLGSAGSLLRLAGVQNLLTVLLAITLFWVAAGNLRVIRIPVLSRILARFSSALRSTFAGILDVRGGFSVLLLGAINGLLPCGLTLLALAYCLTFQRPADGALFMLIFGLGTIPVMIGIPYLINRVLAIRQYPQKVTTIALALSGLLLLLRVFVVHLPEGLAVTDSLMRVTTCP